MTDTGAKWIAAAIFGAAAIFFLFGAFDDKYQMQPMADGRGVFRLNRLSGEIVVCTPSGSHGSHAIYFSCD